MNDRMIHHKYKNNMHTLLNHNPLLLVVTNLFNIKMKVKILLPAGSEYGFPAPLPRRTVDSLGLSLLLKPVGKRNYIQIILTTDLRKLFDYLYTII